MITDEAIEKCLDYLRDSAKEFGRLSGLSVGLEDQKSIIRSQAFLRTDDKLTVSERESLAKTSADYIAICQKYADAVTEFDTIKALRGAADSKISAWQTFKRGERQGHV